jgi:hypothetical protein
MYSVYIFIALFPCLLWNLLFIFGFLMFRAFDWEG